MSAADEPGQKSTPKGLLARLVRAIDAFLRRRMGVWDFADDPDCIFRLALGHAPRDVVLDDGTRVARGERVAILHLWGDHMPTIPASGADLAWARRVTRALDHSLRLLAEHVAANPALADVPAIGNDTTFPYTPGTVRMLERIGFSVLEPVAPSGPIQRLVLLGARVWTWLLRHAYNRESAAGLRLGDLGTRPLWMSRTTLLERHLPGGQGLRSEAGSGGKGPQNTAKHARSGM